MQWKQSYILIFAAIIGFFLTIQTRSFEGVNDLLMRDQESNIFQEIQILTDKNEDLENEVQTLEDTYDQISDQNFVLGSIEEDIRKYQNLNGDKSVFGPGITVKLEGNITTPWITDLINDFFNSGAQAVAVNGIRITNRTVGFDTLPQRQILLNGSILSAPYVFDVIGESKVLSNILELPGGIFDRLQNNFPDLKIEVTQKEVIQMI